MNTVVVRTLSGIGFVLIMLGGLLFSKFLFAALIILIMASCMSEFYRMTMGGKFRLTRLFAIFSGVSVFCLLFAYLAFGIPLVWVSLAMMPALALMATSLFAKDKDCFRDFSNIYTGLLYIALPLALSNLIAFNASGEFKGTLLLSFFIVIWCSDIGAFAVGMLFGRNGRKLWPAVSPNKSWAGVWGGLGLAVAGAVVLHLCGLLLPDVTLVHTVILAALMDVAGVFGDLFESQWKRVCGVKDSGNVIPGHGGMLDRFDSTLFAVPVGAVYVAILGLM